MIDRFARSAVDAGVGKQIEEQMVRASVADYAVGKSEYHFEFLRKDAQRSVLEPQPFIPA